MLDLCRYLSWFRPDHFFIGGNNIMDSYFSWKRWSKVKNVSMDLFLTNALLFTSQDVNWWTGVVWMKQHLWIIVMFLSAVWTLILSWASDGMQLECISPNLFPWRNKLIYILDGLRLSTFSANLNFCLNYSFKWT